MSTDNQRKSQAMRRLSDKLFDEDGEFEWEEHTKRASFYLERAVTLQRLEAARDALRSLRVSLEPNLDSGMVAVFEQCTFPWEL